MLDVRISSSILSACCLNNNVGVLSVERTLVE